MKEYVFDSRPKAHPDAVVQGPNYRFTVLTDGLFRYEWSEDGKFEDRASTFVINRELPIPKFKVIDNKNELEIVTSRFHLSYDKKRFSSNGLMATFAAKVTQWGAPWRYGDFGQDESKHDQAPRRNLGGTARTLDEVDGRCNMGTGVCSRFGYAALDDSKSMLFDGHGFVAGREPGDRIDGYVFCYAHDYKEAVKAYYAISGKQPVIPRWALGNWWSRYWAYSADEYTALMDKFRKKDIPLSVAVVDMDWHYVLDDRVTHAGWTGYTWDSKLFPDPTAFGREMHKKNLKITLNDHPHSGVHEFEDSYKEMAAFLGHDTSHGHPIPFDPTSPKFMEAYLNILHRNVEKQACDFWWIDWQQGETSKIPGVDPLWMLNHFHFLDNARGGQKPLIFSRFAGPGSQRYPVGFSGDTITTWESLDFQPEFTSTASNIGYGWWSHDIGGHMMGYRDDELVTRWIEFGVFSPVMRLHSSNSAWASKEPWLFRKECEVTMEKYLRLRHRMIPYLYTANVAASTKDEPLVQPMYWSFPERDEAYAVPNQYFFGSELMVAPITKPRDKRTNLASVKAWLPPAHRYVDIFTGTVYDGDRELNLYRSLEDYPVLAHEGSIIPLDAAAAPKNGGGNPEEFEILVVIGNDGQFSILEDPADDSPEAQKVTPESGERGSLIQYKQKEGKLVANVTGRTWSFRFLSITSPPKGLKVLVNGKTTKAEISTTSYPEAPSVLIKVPAQAGEKYEITIKLGSDPQLSVLDHTDRVRDLIRDYQMDFGTKDRIWSVVEDRKAPLSSNIAKLLSLGLDEVLMGPVAELMLADSRSTPNAAALKEAEHDHRISYRMQAKDEGA